MNKVKKICGWVLYMIGGLLLLGILGFGSVRLYYTMNPEHCVFKGPDSCWEWRGEEEIRKNRIQNVGIFLVALLISGSITIVGKRLRK